MRWKFALVTASFTFGMLVIESLPLQSVAKSKVVTLGASHLQPRSPHLPLPTAGNPAMQLSRQERSQHQPLTINTMKLGGISLLLTESQVRAMLGQPQDTTDGDNALIGGAERYLYYAKNGIHGIQLIKDKPSGQFVVFSILVNDIGAATHNGIQIKDSRQKLIQAFGPPSSIENQGDNQEILYYSSSDKQAYLSFTVFHDLITQISMSRQVSLSGQTPAIVDDKSKRADYEKRVGQRHHSPQANISTAQTPRSPFSIRSLEIGGISTSSTEVQVKQRLGNPQRIETKYWGCCGNVKIFYYSTAAIKLVEGEKPGTFQVFALSTKQPEMATREGIRVGDSQQKILATFGKPSSTRQESGVTTLFYTLDKYAASLWFQVQNRRIIEMGFTEELT